LRQNDTGEIATLSWRKNHLHENTSIPITRIAKIANKIINKMRITEYRKWTPKSEGEKENSRNVGKRKVNEEEQTWKRKELKKRIRNLTGTKGKIWTWISLPSSLFANSWKSFFYTFPFYFIFVLIF